MDNNFNQNKKVITGNIIYVFIDASNVWSAVKSVKKFIEYKTLKDYFRKNFNADKVEMAGISFETANKWSFWELNSQVAEVPK